MKYSLVVIAPAEYRDIINAAAESMGYGPDNLSAPFSADGNPPATHYGLRAWANAEFRHGYSAMFPSQLLSKCIVDWRFHDPSELKQHAAEVAAAHNLKRIENVEDI